MVSFTKITWNIDKEAASKEWKNLKKWTVVDHNLSTRNKKEHERAHRNKKNLCKQDTLPTSEYLRDILHQQVQEQLAQETLWLSRIVHIPWLFVSKEITHRKALRFIKF